MRSFITGDDLANTVKMAHSQRRVAFLLVEGTTDAKFFQRFTHPDRCEVLACHGRANAMSATVLLDEGREAGFLTFVDADWDRVSGRAPSSPNCVWSDHHDLVVDLLCSPALGRVLAERGSRDKIAAFSVEAGKNVLQAILEEAAALGRLRWHNESSEMGLKFTDFEIHRYVQDEALRLNFADVVRVVIQRSNASASDEELHEHCQRLADGGFDFRQVASGHDAVAILSVGLRRRLGSQRAQDVRVDVIELELRLAFDWDCLKQTTFYTSIRTWESHNTDWLVLQEDDAVATRAS